MLKPIKDIRRVFSTKKYDLMDAHFHLNKDHDLITSLKYFKGVCKLAGYNSALGLIHGNKINELNFYQELYKLVKNQPIFPGIETKSNHNLLGKFHEIIMYENGKRIIIPTHPFKNNGVLYELNYNNIFHKQKNEVIKNNYKKKRMYLVQIFDQSIIEEYFELVKKQEFKEHEIYLAKTFILTNPTKNLVQLCLDNDIRIMAGTDFHPRYKKTLGDCGTIIPKEIGFEQLLCHDYEIFWNEKGKTYFTKEGKIKSI